LAGLIKYIAVDGTRLSVYQLKYYVPTADEIHKNLNYYQPHKTLLL